MVNLTWEDIGEHLDKGDLEEWLKEERAKDKARQLNEYADAPQTDSEITRNSLRTDCNGCRFVGTYDTEFPCANCTRKNKDYYDADTPQTESTGSPIGDYRDAVGAWQTDCPYREYLCDMCDEQTDCQWK